MKVWMLFHGGSNYALFDTFNRDDCEEFESIEAAKRAFERRADFDPYWPCVENPEAWICFVDPFECDDVYPDRIITLGPRGGVRVEMA